MNALRSWSVAAMAPVFLVSCGQPDYETRKEHVRGYLQDLLIDENWSEWTGYFSSDASLNGSDFALQIMRGTSGGLHFSFGDLTVVVAEQVAEGELVATRFSFHGIHERPFNDQPATGLSVELSGTAIDRFENGLIVESRMLLDVWGLSQRTAAAVNQE